MDRQRINPERSRGQPAAPRKADGPSCPGAVRSLRPPEMSPWIRFGPYLTVHDGASECGEAFDHVPGRVGDAGGAAAPRGPRVLEISWWQSIWKG
jgi:hypothetical protein